MVCQRSGGKPRTKARLCSAADSRPLPIRNVVIASHTSKFSNTFCCKCHKGEVYFKKQSFTSTSSEIYYWK